MLTRTHMRSHDVIHVSLYYDSDDCLIIHRLITSSIVTSSVLKEKTIKNLCVKLHALAALFISVISYDIDIRLCKCVHQCSSTVEVGIPLLMSAT